MSSGLQVWLPFVRFQFGYFDRSFVAVTQHFDRTS
jgi:hypothetical protein